MIDIDISYKITTLAKKYDLSSLKVANDYCYKENDWFKREMNRYRSIGLTYKNAWDKTQSTIPSHLLDVLDRYYQTNYKTNLK